LSGIVAGPCGITIPVFVRPEFFEQQRPSTSLHWGGAGQIRLLPRQFTLTLEQISDHEAPAIRGHSFDGATDES
jgi:hypothetical protein